MKTLNLFTLFFLYTLFIHAQDYKTLGSEKDIKTTFEKATQENKLVYLVFYGDFEKSKESKLLIQTILSDSEIKIKLNAKTVPLLINYDTPMGKAYTDYNSIQILPTNLILHPETGLIIKRRHDDRFITNKETFTAFIDDGVQAKSWFDNLSKKDLSHITGEEASKIYSKAKSLDYTERLQYYFIDLIGSQLNDDSWWDSKHEKTFLFSPNSIDDSNMRYLLKNKERFINTFGDENWFYFLSNLKSSFISLAIKNQDIKIINRMIDELHPYFENSKEELIMSSYLSKIQFYSALDDQDGFESTFIQMINDDYSDKNVIKSIFDKTIVKADNLSTSFLQKLITYYEGQDPGKDFLNYFNTLSILYKKSGDIALSKNLVEAFKEYLKGSANDSNESQLELIRQIHKTLNIDSKIIEEAAIILETLSFESYDLKKERASMLIDLYRRINNKAKYNKYRQEYYDKYN